MTELYVDPDGLTATAEVASRQYNHIGRVSSYISTTCSQFGAFSGVLNIFEGSYREAVTSAVDGMRDGQTIATKVQTTVTGCRDSYLETDHGVYDKMKKLLGTEEGFPPYVAPGSGRSVPGGPLESPTTPEDSTDGDPEGPAVIKPIVDGVIGRMFPNPDDDTPGLIDPKGTAKDAVLDHIREEQANRRYDHYRDLGMSDAEAQTATDRDMDDIAQDRVDTTTRERTESAYDDAHDRAVAEGKTPEEARQAGQDAAQDQHHTDTEDTRRRGEIGDTAGTYYGAYGAVDETIGNVNDFVDGVKQLDETTDDIDDYNDYEGREDHSAQDWGNT